MSVAGFSRRRRPGSERCNFADVVVAYAPGGLEAMTILAFALHLDPVFVGAHHLSRAFSSVGDDAAVCGRAISRGRGRPPETPEKEERFSEVETGSRKNAREQKLLRRERALERQVEPLPDIDQRFGASASIMWSS